MHLWLHFAVFLVDARRWNYHDLLALSFNPKRACCCSRAVAAVLFYIALRWHVDSVEDQHADDEMHLFTASQC
jgi:hypothetical protein